MNRHRTAPVTAWTAPEPTPGPAPGVEFAEPSERLIAYIIDVLIIVGVVILLSVIGAIFLVILPIVSIFFWVAATAFGFVYFPYFWAKDGQTIGNRQRHIRVVRDVDGGPLSMGTAILRLVGYWISGRGLLHRLHLDPHRQAAPRLDGPHRGHGRGQGLSIRSIARLGTALALLAWTVVLAGCVPGEAESSSPSAAPSAPGRLAGAPDRRHPRAAGTARGMAGVRPG